MKKKPKTMHEMYGEPNDKFGKHIACEKCGFCKTCGDCWCEKSNSNREK